MRKDNKSLEDNLKRLHVLSGIKPINETKTGTHSTLVESVKSGSLTYAIVKEGGFYYIKSTTSDVLNESTLDYVGGLANKKEFKFNSYADALKSLNLIKLNESEQDMIDELLSKDIDPVGNQAPEGQGMPQPAPMPNPEPQAQQAAPAPQPEPEMSAAPAPEGQPAAAPIADPEFDETNEDQIDHFVGKLTAELRKQGEDTLTGDRLKGILKSIIAAIPLERIDPETRLEIAKRIKDGKQKEDDEEDSEAPVDDVAPAPAPEGQPAPQPEAPVDESIIDYNQSKNGEEKLLNHFKEAIQAGQNLSIDEVKKAGEKCKLNEQEAMSVFYEAYTSVMSDKSNLQQVAEEKQEVNSKDDQKINEFFHNNRKNVLFENNQLVVKGIVVESSGNKVTLSKEDKKYEYIVSENTISKLNKLIDHKKTQKLTEEVTNNLKNI